MHLVLSVFRDSMFADSEFATFCNFCCASKKFLCGHLLLKKRLVSSAYVIA